MAEKICDQVHMDFESGVPDSVKLRGEIKENIKNGQGKLKIIRSDNAGIQNYILQK